MSAWEASWVQECALAGCGVACISERASATLAIAPSRSFSFFSSFTMTAPAMAWTVPGTAPREDEEAMGGLPDATPQDEAASTTSALDTAGFYAALNLPRDADEEAVRRAYRSLAGACHPDKVAMELREAAAAEFARLQRAYEVRRERGGESMERAARGGQTWRAFNLSGRERGTRRSALGARPALARRRPERVRLVGARSLSLSRLPRTLSSIFPSIIRSSPTRPSALSTTSTAPRGSKRASSWATSWRLPMI